MSYEEKAQIQTTVAETLQADTDSHSFYKEADRKEIGRRCAETLDGIILNNMQATWQKHLGADLERTFPSYMPTQIQQQIRNAVIDAISAKIAIPPARTDQPQP